MSSRCNELRAAAIVLSILIQSREDDCFSDSTVERGLEVRTWGADEPDTFALTSKYNNNNIDTYSTEHFSGTVFAF